MALLHQAGEDLCTTRINVAELLVGVWRSKSPGLEEPRVRTLIRPLPILEFGPTASERYALIQAQALFRGRPIADADLMIAAIAMDSQSSVLTRNARHFTAIPGLTVLSY